MMKQSLQLKLGQQLTMTPQLQQAIKLLQLSTLDLQQEIQQALESNPMLEVAEEDHTLSDADSNVNAANNGDEPPPTKDGPTELSAEAGTETSSPAEAAEPDSDWQQDIPEDLPVDSSWDEVYQSSAGVSSGPGPASDDFDFESRNSATETLQDHLQWQLNLTPMSDTDRVIAIAVIDAIEPTGFLSLSAEEIHAGFDTELDIDLDEVIAVLHRVQQFDPPGIAAHDLQECLLLQLRQLPADTPWLQPAQNVIEQHLTLLGSRDYRTIMRRSKLKEPELKEVIELIQTLNPRPGDIVDSSNTEYVTPDVYVKKIAEDWLVDLNPDIAPKLRINDSYASMVKRADNSTDNTYLKDNLQEARWFLKSLQSRNDTLLKVATCIVEHQRDFFEYGEEAMKPLVLHDIAEVVEMHESTISRVTTQKYMHTPQGIFELKYFFSSHVGTDTGGECSSTAIRAMIKKLVAAEEPKKPLSDSKIATLLAEQGIKVARRTIAKYRESLAIPPSNERKRLV